MSNLKEQAIKILQNVPDDKMAYVIDMLKCLNNIFDNKSMVDDKLEAWERFKKYKGIISYNIDEKAELARARDEKYANFN